MRLPRGSWRAILGVAVTVFVAVATLLSPTPARSPLPAPPSPIVSNASGSPGIPALLTGAASSLLHGAGPAHGQAWQCSVFGVALTCPGRPAGGPTTPVQLNWFNQTSYTNDQPGGGKGYPAEWATAAFDPDLAQVVLFGGCSTQCPSNQTWFYDGVWFNGGLAVAPPPLFGQSMAWDPQYDAVILVGGVDAAGNAVNATWAYNNLTGWSNITSRVGAPSLGSNSAHVWASLAWDDGLHELLLVDGCGSRSCSTVYDQEWSLGPLGWVDRGAGPTSTTVRDQLVYNGSMAYDRADHEMVFFGGYSSNASSATNLTFVLPTANNTWTNLTRTSAYCTVTNGCHSPSAREDSAMTWDGQLQEVVLFGGFNRTIVDNDTWFFNGTTWLASSNASLGTSVGGPLGVAGGALASNSSEIPPVLIGGSCAPSTGCLNLTNVFEVPPASRFIRVAPSPADMGAEVNLSAYQVVGSGSGPFLSYYFSDTYGNAWFDYSQPSNFTTNQSFGANFSYSLTGTYGISLQTSDFFGVTTFTNTTIIVVSNVTAKAEAFPSTTEAGFRTLFNATGTTGGVLPYSVVWNFGDSSAPVTSSGPVLHIFASGGTYSVIANVSDAGGGWNITVISDTVYSQLTASSTSNYSQVDVNVSVQFTGAAHGGAPGVNQYSWSFGDGGRATSASAIHTYTRTGTYLVNLSVNDSAGFAANASPFAVPVNPALSATVTESTNSTDAGASVTFSAGYSGGTLPFIFVWSFGDGATASGASVTHAFRSGGTFNVTVTVTDGGGGRVVRSEAVSVTKSPASLLDQLTSGTGLYVLIAASVLIAAAIVGAVAVRRRRRRPSQTMARGGPSERRGGPAEPSESDAYPEEGAGGQRV